MFNKTSFFLGILMAFMSLSCQSFLDIKPEDSLTTSSYYQTKQQINNALTALYAPLKGTALGENYLIRVIAPSDEGYYFSKVRIGPATISNSADDSDIYQVWQACYVAINYANNLLEGLEKSSTLDITTQNHARGEAKFLRGYYYFLLAQWFGDVPLHLDASKNANDGIRERKPVKEVYDQIIKDMTEADSLLEDQTLIRIGYAERVTKSAVEGILARVCLYAAGEPVNDTKRYKDALFWAKKLIASGEHALNSDFRQIFINHSQDKYDLKESIWEVGYSFVGSGSSQNASGVVGVYAGVAQTYTPMVNGVVSYDSGYVYGYEKVHPRLYNIYEAGDVRRDWTIGNYNYNNGIRTYLSPTQLWERMPAKWRREYESAQIRSEQRSNSTNFPLLRYSDVLLMLAEAENEVNGPTDLAYEAINQVRRRAIIPTKVVNTLLMTNQGSGYTSVPSITITGGGGIGLSILPTVVSGRVHLILRNQGNSYTSSPTISIGNQWQNNTYYSAGTQVAVASRLYNVTLAGTSTNTAPSNGSGSSSAATTGAVFTYVGPSAQVIAILSNQPTVELPMNFSKSTFRKAIQDERYRELAFEGLRFADLRRWGILVSTFKSLANDINGNSLSIPVAPVNLAVEALGPVNNISARDIFWPIPIRDLILNPKMAQNVGF